MKKLIVLESPTPTPYAVRCIYNGDNGGRPIFLTRESYDSQMESPDALWLCPRCGDRAEWDDENYELAMEGLDEL